jgi:hypothetical protein
MKLAKLMVSALLSISAFTTVAAQAASFEGQAYTRAARFEHPLDTYDSCGPNSEAGYEAHQVALNEAMLACRQGYNADCVVTGTRYVTILSREFIGYKACEAQVTVHGYRMSGAVGEDEANNSDIQPPSANERR